MPRGYAAPPHTRARHNSDAYRTAQGRPHEKALLEQPYTVVAEMLHCTPTNVAIVNSATAAWQRVFLGLPLWQPGSRIITSVAEYGSNYLAYLQVWLTQPRGDIDRILESAASATWMQSCRQNSCLCPSAAPSTCTNTLSRNHTKYSNLRLIMCGTALRTISWRCVPACMLLQVAKRFDVAIHVIRETADGDIDIGHLEQVLDEPASGFTLVSVSHIPTSSGRVYDAEAVGAAVARHPGMPPVLAALACGASPGCLCFCMNLLAATCWELQHVHL